MAVVISSDWNPKLYGQIRALSRAEFGPRAIDYDIEHGQNLEKTLALNQIVSASENGKLLGFGIYFFLSESERHPTWWYAAAFKDQEILETIVKGIEEKSSAAGYRGKVSFKLYKNSFTKEYNPQDMDMYMAGMVVDAGHRGRGIGTKLVNSRLDVARANQVSRVFVDCCLDEGVDRSYQRLGFQPAVRMQPGDRKGSAYLNMGLKL